MAETAAEFVATVFWTRPSGKSLEAPRAEGFHWTWLVAGALLWASAKLSRNTVAVTYFIVASLAAYYRKFGNRLFPEGLFQARALRRGQHGGIFRDVHFVFHAHAELAADV